MQLTDINIRDPFILPYAGKYYLYGSRVCTDTDGNGWGLQTGFDVFVSRDLETWSEPKSVFEITPAFWATKQAWAPEVHVYNGRFYMFATFKADDKCRATHVLVCDTPDGDFKPLTDAPITPPDWECLDGTLYIDKQGEPHVVFCHEWLQVGDGTVCEMQLSRDLTHAVSAPRTLWHASVYADVRPVHANTITYVTDGPFLLRDSKGDLCCLWSTFNQNGYAELICKSSNGDIDGEWRITSRPLSVENGGHGMVFETFEGERLFVMHRPNNSPLERPVLFKLKEDEQGLHI